MSQPIEHSPGPWHVGQYVFRIQKFEEHRGLETCIVGPNGKKIVELYPYGITPTNEDLKLIAAAPTMYRIIRQICNEDWQCREQGLRSAQFLLQELEGGPDGEA